MIAKSCEDVAAKLCARQRIVVGSSEYDAIMEDLKAWNTEQSAAFRLVCGKLAESRQELAQLKAALVDAEAMAHASRQMCVDARSELQVIKAAVCALAARYGVS